MPDHIFDNTVLSNLASVGRLDLLRKRYVGSACTTVEVCDELRKGVNAGYAYLDVVLKSADSEFAGGWLHVLAPQSAGEQRLRAEFDLTLDAGEASCLVLALARGLVLVTDDLAARRLAQVRGVALTGTIGILVGSVRDGTVSLEEANAILAGMIASRYRAPVERLDKLI